jgi:outer membrane protein assembly factor BamD (BamD/ComL family)
MKKTMLVLILLATVTISGCSGDKGKELYETAQFEEKQHNLPHAIQLYEEIASKHPGSTFAAKAQERLTALKNTKAGQ